MLLPSLPIPLRPFPTIQHSPIFTYMKKLVVFALLLVSVSRVSAQQAEHVVVVTIDGFRPDFYLDPSWNTPNLRQLMQQGTHAKGVNSVFPSMTYPSHTTIVTGVCAGPYRQTPR